VCAIIDRLVSIKLYISANFLLRLTKLAEYFQPRIATFLDRLLHGSPIYFLDYLRDYGEFVMADSSPVNRVIDSEYLTRRGQSFE